MVTPCSVGSGDGVEGAEVLKDYGYATAATRSAGCTGIGRSSPTSRSYLLFIGRPAAFTDRTHVMKEWADTYAGKFDDGWDAYRERVRRRAQAMGWIPADAELTPRHPALPAWDEIPADEQPSQSRLMEVAAGFAEQADVPARRVIDEIERLGYGDNTVDMHIKALDEIGGAGCSRLTERLTTSTTRLGVGRQHPHKGMKLLASRDPQPEGGSLTGGRSRRIQFHHCDDLVPTIYELRDRVPDNLRPQR